MTTETEASADTVVPFRSPDLPDWFPSLATGFAGPIMTPPRPMTRRLWPSDASAVLDHHLRLDAQERYLRFGRAVSDEIVRAHCTGLDWSRSILLGTEEDGRLVAVAQLAIMGPAPGTAIGQAEFAVSVEHSAQNRGIGSELLGRIITLARNRSIGRIYVVCLLENRRMQRIAKKHEAMLEVIDTEVEGRIDLKAASPLTLLQEMSDETRSGLQSVLPIWSRPLLLGA